ncbi:MAG: hypothetical protein IPK59_11205 [Rhodospirillaceae bacterium]|nr:hypothetical protein [Rhodospirillaceae bacterium]
MALAPFHRLSIPLIIVAAAILLSGCHKTLVYGEQTGFNLAIQVNDDPKTPVQVNAGLKRTVGQLTPPTSLEADANGNKTNNDAVSTFSGFRLNYAKDGWFMGDLTIKTQFATGAAANALSDDPEAVAAFLSADYERTEEHVDEARIARVKAIAQVIKDSALLPDDKAKLLACNPPLVNIEARNATEFDAECQRTADAEVARKYLLFQAGMGDRTDAQLEAWEKALAME